MFVFLKIMLVTTADANSINTLYNLLLDTKSCFIFRKAPDGWITQRNEPLVAVFVYFSLAH